MIYWKCYSCGLEIEANANYSIDDERIKKCPNLNCEGIMERESRS